jgi:hypothetical protein
MDSKSDLLDSLEEQDEYGLLPDNVEQETHKLLESNENIDHEVVSYALEAASDYWREHLEDNGQVVKGQQGTGFKIDDNFDNCHLKDLSRDIYDEWEHQLEMEEVYVLVNTLTTLPAESLSGGSTWNYNPKMTPENEDHPSMFQ